MREHYIVYLICEYILAPLIDKLFPNDDDEGGDDDK